MPKIIPLSKPMDGHHGAKIKSITLRDPKYRDYMDLGLPVTWVTLADGGGFEQETSSLIGAWIERLADIDPNFLDLLELDDTLALRDAVIGFFREAREAKKKETERALSSKSEESSSSASASTPAPSKI